MKRTTIWLEDADYEAAEIIQKRWGSSSLGDAIRLALRMMAAGIKAAPEYQEKKPD